VILANSGGDSGCDASSVGRAMMVIGDTGFFLLHSLNHGILRLCRFVVVVVVVVKVVVMAAI
jgi:hypothetical protein